MLTQETVSKISTIVLRPGVYDVDFLNNADQVWISVHGAPESVNVAAEIKFLFPELDMHDDTSRITENTDDRVASYRFYGDGLVISLTGWLPKEKDSDESEPTVKNSTSDFTINDLSVEEYLKREA